MNILGIGTAVPPDSMEQEHAAGAAAARCCTQEQERRLLRRAYLGCEIRKRHSTLLRTEAGEPVYRDLFPEPRSPGERGPTTAARMQLYSDHAGPLAVDAARKALDHAAVLPADVTYLITASCTGFFSPGLDLTLIRALRLPPRVGRLHVGFMGCHAAFNALQAAWAIAAAKPESRVLVCAVELCTLHFQYGWDPEQLVSNALFADGAGAAVIGSHASKSNGSTPRIASFGSMLFPDSAEMMTWRIGDHGFEMTLSRRVPDLIRDRLRGWIQEWLVENSLRLDAIRAWAVHPGGPRIVSAVEEALGLDPRLTADSRAVLRDYGNMSSPTVLFILERLLGEAKTAEAARPMVALAFGPGLAVESLLLT